MLVSFLVVAHFVAVVLAPLAVVEPRSQLARSLHDAMSPWTQALYLDHGYRFFAPEPGPGHIIEFEVSLPNGEIEKGRIPDRNGHWPRLLYHRWFMLSETMFQHFSLTLDDAALKSWKEEVELRIKSLVEEGDPRRAERIELEFRQQLREHALFKAEMRHLAARIREFLSRRYNGAPVRLKLVTRMVPDPEEVSSGYRLDDPRFTPGEFQFDLGMDPSAEMELEAIVPRDSRPDPSTPRTNSEHE